MSMNMTEICIERVANGYVIECEYKPQKQRAIGQETAVDMYNSKKIEHIAVDEADLIKQISVLVKKLGTEQVEDDG